MITMCCVCRRTKSGKSCVKKRMAKDAGRTSHGYCPECYQVTMERFRIDYLARQLQVPEHAAVN